MGTTLRVSLLTASLLALVTPSVAPSTENSPTPPVPEVPEEIETPSPRAEGEIEGCTLWYKPYLWDNMEGGLWKTGLTCPEFYAMNPSVGPDCFGMEAEVWYCRSTNPDRSGLPLKPLEWVEELIRSGPSTVFGKNGIGTPRPYHLGMTSDCTSFYLASTLDIDRESIEAMMTASATGLFQQRVEAEMTSILEDHEVRMDDLLRWNRGMYPEHPLMQAGHYYCFGVNDASDVTSEASAGGSTAGAASAPSGAAIPADASISSDVVTSAAEASVSSDVDSASDATTAADSSDTDHAAESAGAPLLPFWNVGAGNCATMGFAMYALQWILGYC